MKLGLRPHKPTDKSTRLVGASKTVPVSKAQVRDVEVPSPEVPVAQHTADNASGFCQRALHAFRDYGSAIAAVILSAAPSGLGLGPATEPLPLSEPDAKVRQVDSKVAEHRSMDVVVLPAKVEKSAVELRTEQVAKVSSLAVLEAEAGLVAAKQNLAKVQTVRLNKISEFTERLSKGGGRASTLERLGSDLTRSIEDVVKTKDSALIHGSLRRDVIKWHAAVKNRQAAIDFAHEAWSRYDSVYASEDVAKPINAAGVDVKLLKALIGQESGDHLQHDVEGDIIGLCQVGTKELMEVAPNLDRERDEDAIVIGALVMERKAEHLKSMLNQRGIDWDAFRAAPDYPKFLSAAYNAGADPIARAINITRLRGGDHTSWQDVAYPTGKADAPLRTALKNTRLYKKWVGAKLFEVRNYVSRIEKRLESPADVPTS